MMKRLHTAFNRWTLAGSVLVALLLCLGLALAGWLSRPVGSGSLPAAAIVTNIPAPTPTPYVEPTATLPSDQLTATPGADQIGIGAFVQISGTGGDGLRIRKLPGLNGEALFLGYDSEVFQVTDGPQFVDGFSWWYLTAPYDPNRSGWAAANYLAVIPAPQPTP